jgi:transcription antitermination factor NusG
MIAEMERQAAPDDVFPCLRSIPSLTGWWWFCMTHGGKVKALARKLAAARVDYFLPLSEYRILRNDRGRQYEIRKTRALYPNYIFLNGDDAREIASHAAEKVSIYPVSAKFQPRLQIELEHIAKALEVNPALGTSVHDFTKDQKVRVVRGPFMGVVGYFDYASPRQQVWLRVEMLGQKGLSLEVPVEFIEAAD